MSQALEDGKWRCKPCDRQFPSWESLLQHKAYKQKTGAAHHIHCQFCGQDFETDVARKRHVQQSHPKWQLLACPGCGRGPFHRLASLMSHVENGDCPCISSDSLDEAREKKLEFTRRLAALTHEPVKNDYTRFVSDGKPAERSGSPLIPAAQESGVGRDEAGIKNTNTASLGGGEKPGAHTSWKEKENLLPDAAAAQPEKERCLFQSMDLDDPANPSFSAETYYSELIGQYICPKLGCGKVFKTSGRLIGHLRGPAHGDKTFRCPYCHKTFKSLTAISSHVESSSINCRISETDGYNAYLDQLTAGMVDLGRQYEDGTVQYTTADSRSSYLKTGRGQGTR
ncbi:hypothetical protein E4U41_003332 [Claviceps citrina]|nr:hypothetical protein E4U41_003332 [Claviceps citrina]